MEHVTHPTMTGRAKELVWPSRSSSTLLQNTATIQNVPFPVVGNNWISDGDDDSFVGSSNDNDDDYDLMDWDDTDMNIAGLEHEKNSTVFTPQSTVTNETPTVNTHMSPVPMEEEMMFADPSNYRPEFLQLMRDAIIEQPAFVHHTRHTVDYYHVCDDRSSSSTTQLTTPSTSGETDHLSEEQVSSTKSGQQSVTPCFPPALSCQGRQVSAESDTTLQKERTHNIKDGLEHLERAIRRSTASRQSLLNSINQVSQLVASSSFDEDQDDEEVVDTDTSDDHIQTTQMSTIVEESRRSILTMIQNQRQMEEEEEEDDSFLVDESSTLFCDPNQHRSVSFQSKPTPNSAFTQVMKWDAEQQQCSSPTSVVR